MKEKKYRNPIASLAYAGSLLVAVDFDGTIALLDDDPSNVQSLPLAAEALLRLSLLENTKTAIISGRSLEVLMTVAPKRSNVILVGSHGAEFMLGDSQSSKKYSPPISQNERDLIALLRDIVKPLVESTKGAWMEEKSLGVAIHTRLISDEQAHHLQQEIVSHLSHLRPKPHLRYGHDVMEYSVSWLTKGDALQHLRNQLEDAVTLYIGDDVTDEDAFAVLTSTDVSVKCGLGDTLADYSVPTPHVVARLLSALATQRELIYNRI